MIRHEKIFKRDDGTRYNIGVAFSVTTSNPIWYFSVTRCLPNKRKFETFIDEDSYQYRMLRIEERKLSYKLEALNYITKDEILEVMNELHQSLKPTHF